MMAANLAVVCNMSVDDVEDVRMAAEEGFVYSCATAPESCDVTFELSEAQVRASFSLGAEPVDPSDDALGLAELLLSAVCDEHGLSDDGSTLVLVKRAGQAYGE
jgi:serine/threonine-protein kinase RsbW